MALWQGLGRGETTDVALLSMCVQHCRQDSNGVTLCFTLKAVGAYLRSLRASRTRDRYVAMCSTPQYASRHPMVEPKLRPKSK